MDLLQKSKALCPKRKPDDDCLARNSKSQCIEIENVSSKVHSGSSLDVPAHSYHSQPNLANDCVNYLKSGVPSRVVFYKQGSWCDFPDKILTSIVDAFEGDKSSVVVVMDDQPLLIDFLSMTLVNLKTRKQRSVAWLDGTNNWSFPSSFFDEEVDKSAKLRRNVVEGAALDFVGGNNVMNSPSDVAKRAMLEASPPVVQNSSALDILRKKIVHVARGSESFLFVQNLFLSGMGSFAVPNNILHIHRYSPKDIPAQLRLESFEKQLRLTGKNSGNVNAKYGWLGSGKQDIVSVIINGFVSTGKDTHDTAVGDGIYLSPENRAFTSVRFCDIDEKGVQYMLLCQAILGKTGVITPGSQEEFLGIYDTGVDNCSNPNYYVMHPSRISTNISAEYLITFRLAPKVQEYLLSLKGLWLRTPPAEVGVDPSILQPVLCQIDEGPTSPWISFRVLFEAIQDSISSLARELLYRHYEELKEKKITRDEMVKKMMIIVGEKLLLDSVKKLKYSPSVWYNSPAKMASYPATLESVSNGTRSTDVQSTTSHDSPALSVPRQRCEPVNSTRGGYPANAVRGQLHSPTPSMCSESSSYHCDDALVRSALLSLDVWDSAGASIEYNGHDPLSQSFSTDHDSHVSRPTVGNSAPLSMEGLHSPAPSMTPEAHEPPASSRAHPIVTETPGVACQVYTPSRVPQFSAARSMAPELYAPRSMAPHLRAPGSMAPHLRVQSKVPKVPGKKIVPEVHYSSAATAVPVISKPPSSSVLPKETGLLTSSNERVTPSLILEGPDRPANRPTKLQNTPNLKNVAPKNRAAQCGSNKNLPRMVAGGSNTITNSSGTLITLPADGEKGM